MTTDAPRRDSELPVTRESMDSPWVKRLYRPSTDENAVVYLWLKSHAHSPFGRARGAQHDGSDEERAYWASHRKIVMRLLEYGMTEVLCDPEDPNVIWAFACTAGDTVHYLVVKRRFKELAQDMFKDLLGDRLDRAVEYTHDLTGTGLKVPSSWMLNPYGACI